MRAVTGGRGPVLLLLHGYPESLCAWHGVAPQLARDHLVVAVDLPGYGGSHLTETSAVVTRPSRHSIAAGLPGGHLLPETAADAVSAQLATFVARCTAAAAKSHSGDRR